jgi:hypothetical protein
MTYLEALPTRLAMLVPPEHQAKVSTMTTQAIDAMRDSWASEMEQQKITKHAEGKPELTAVKETPNDSH